MWSTSVGFSHPAQRNANLGSNDQLVADAPCSGPLSNDLFRRSILAKTKLRIHIKIK